VISMNTSRIADAVYHLRLPADALEQLRSIKERDGIPVSEQMRRGIQLWIAQQQKGRK
jgi:hypothetical protein